MSQVLPVNVQTSVIGHPKTLGNPGVVGLCAFGMTTLLAQAHSFGLVGVGPVIYLAVVFGGMVQLLAGLQEHKNGNNFGYCAFASFGSFWLCFAGIVLGNRYEIFKTEPADIGVFLLGWTALCVILWFVSRGVSKAMFYCFATLVGGLGCLSLAHLGYPAFEEPGAVCLTLAALIAWYMMAHVLVVDFYGRDLLPVGKPFVNSK